MLRCPPRSPRFPYPTPLRSVAAIDDAQSSTAARRPAPGPGAAALGDVQQQADGGEQDKHARVAVGDERQRHAGERSERSEEHTSELQSRQYLVCRLLLEKKQ